MEDHNNLLDCIQLIKKLPVHKLDENINAISNIIYEKDDLLNEFLQKVDTRTELCTDDVMGEFIKCEQNRDGDSYRSPLTNSYFPPMEEARYPRKELRELEIKLNKIFSLYAKQYYSQSTIASAYCWELTDKIEDGFSVCVAIKNNVKVEKEISSGKWDSSNLVNVSFQTESNGSITATFTLTSTVVLQMAFYHELCGHVSLSGTVGRQTHETSSTKSYFNDELFIATIGNMIEDTENSLRNTIEEIYIKKTKEIIDTSRFSPVVGKPNLDQANKLKDVFSNK